MYYKEEYKENYNKHHHKHRRVKKSNNCFLWMVIIAIAIGGFILCINTYKNSKNKSNEITNSSVY